MAHAVSTEQPPYNIAARFFAAAEKFADHPAVGMAGEDDYLTYRQMAERIRACAQSLGPLDSGEPIGILSENRPEWGQAYLAILARGGIAVPVDSLLKKDELARIISESGIGRLIVSEKYHAIAESVVARFERRPQIIDLEHMTEGDPAKFDSTPSDDPDSPAALIFTSGTTGNSKKVVLTHRNIISDMEGFIARLSFGPGDRFLSVLPLHHTFEATCGFIAPLSHGAAVYYVKALNSREILQGIKRHRITHFISVPLIYDKLYHGILNAVNKAPAPKRAVFKLSMTATRALYLATGANVGKKMFKSMRKKAGLDSIQLMVSGGAPLPPEISMNFNFMGINFIEGYGLTETSPVLCVNPLEKTKFGSVGPPLHNVELKIHEPDQNGAGEIIVRGPMVTPGYLDNPEETAGLIRDGWLHTGDIGRMDKDGYLFISGRKKNLIVSAAGKNIYPEEIEAELLKSTFILEVMIWGKKTDAGREEVAALIHPDFDALAARLGKSADAITDADIKSVIDAEVKTLCAGLADFKRVKHIEYVREELEKTSTKKIKRYLYQR
jgi:long-chain acyl-CoA synthetase